MGEKKLHGFRFIFFPGDHPPLHVHIFKGDKFLGRFDLVSQVSMDDRLMVTGKLRSALQELGYLKQH